jgi:hypothetical protein
VLQRGISSPRSGNISNLQNASVGQSQNVRLVKKDISEIHANQRSIPKEEQMEELKREETIIQTANRKYTCRVWIEIPTHRF